METLYTALESFLKALGTPTPPCNPNPRQTKLGSSLLLYPNIKPSSKYASAVYPRIAPPWPEHVLGQWRMVPRHAASGSDTAEAGLSYIYYIYTTMSSLSPEYQGILTWNTTLHWSIHTQRLFTDIKTQNPLICKIYIKDQPSSLPPSRLFSPFSFVLRTPSILL